MPHQEYFLKQLLAGVPTLPGKDCVQRGWRGTLLRMGSPEWGMGSFAQEEAGPVSLEQAVLPARRFLQELLLAAHTHCWLWILLWELALPCTCVHPHCPSLSIACSLFTGGYKELPSRKFHYLSGRACPALGAEGKAVLGSGLGISAPLQSDQRPIPRLHRFSGAWAQENVVIEGGTVGGLAGQPGPGPCREDVQGWGGPGAPTPSGGAWCTLMLTRIKDVKHQNYGLAGFILLGW